MKVVKGDGERGKEDDMDKSRWWRGNFLRVLFCGCYS